MIKLFKQIPINTKFFWKGFEFTKVRETEAVNNDMGEGWTRFNPNDVIEVREIKTTGEEKDG